MCVIPVLQIVLFAVHPKFALTVIQLLVSSIPLATLPVLTDTGWRTALFVPLVTPCAHFVLILQQIVQNAPYQDRIRPSSSSINAIQHVQITHSSQHPPTNASFATNSVLSVSAHSRLNAQLVLHQEPMSPS